MKPSTLLCDNCGAANQSQSAYCRSCGLPLQAAKPSIYHSSSGQLLTNILLKQRYRIVASLGQGGMGVVYKAEDTQLGNRQVALKEMIQSGLNPQEQKDAADAFKQEAIMLARLHHPNLPNIFDHFEENGRWYLVMNFIKGETLFDYMSHSQRRKLPLDEVVQIGTQLCTVLSYLHNQQPAIIFRDLKLANVMRTPEGHIYLIDFGIARHFKGNQTRDTRIGYTPGYAAPEQYGRSQTSPRSDIYSLGVVLYQLLSGHNPSATPFQFPPLRSLVPTVPIELATLITQMLELDENKRPASMQIIGQKLQSVITSPRGIPPTPPLQPLAATSRAPIASSHSQRMERLRAHVATSKAPISPPNFPPVRSNREPRPVMPLRVWLLITLFVILVGGISWEILANSHPAGNLGQVYATPTPALTIIPGGGNPNLLAIKSGTTWIGKLEPCGNSLPSCGVKLMITSINADGSFQGFWYADFASLTGGNFEPSNPQATREPITGRISSDNISWNALGKVDYGGLDPNAAHSGTINSDGSISGDQGNLYLQKN